MIVKYPDHPKDSCHYWSHDLFLFQGPHITFYVETAASANALRNLNQAITMSDGSRLSIQVIHSIFSPMKLTPFIRTPLLL